MVFMCQVVRLLSRLMTQKSDYWTTSQHSSCQCYTEVKLLSKTKHCFAFFHTNHKSLSSLSGGPDGIDSLPPSVARFSWFSGADRFNRSVTFKDWIARLEISKTTEYFLFSPSGLDPPQRCSSNSLQYWWHGTAPSLLRECLMLLHWLVLHHGSFSESCRPLLHMYDQVIPAVRDTLRRIPELSESEGIPVNAHQGFLFVWMVGGF